MPVIGPGKDATIRILSHAVNLSTNLHVRLGCAVKLAYAGVDQEKLVPFLFDNYSHFSDGGYHALLKIFERYPDLGLKHRARLSQLVRDDDPATRAMATNLLAWLDARQTPTLD